MNVNKIKIVKDNLDKFVNVPVNIQWDFMGQEDSIEEYETSVIKQVIGNPIDFEIAKFTHRPFPNQDTEINYDFYFYDNLIPITNNVVGNWDISYLNNGFSVQDVYFFSKPFTKSFFKLDFYDTMEEKDQQIFLSIILPTQQGRTETAVISNITTPIEIKKPKMVLDFLGDKEGFTIYWLKKRNYIDIDTFYMTAKFFNAREGVFKQMTNTRQDNITPNKFDFNNADYFYYKVSLDYETKTYQVFSTSTNQRVGGTNSPINFYEYVNP